MKTTEKTGVERPLHQYVAGLMFNPAMTKVGLILKLKPEWQRGKLNGIGGKVEDHESSHDAMSREFKEETGVLVPPASWRPFAVLGGSEEDGHPFTVDFFATIGDVEALESTTEERVEVIYTDEIDSYTTIENLPWLIPLAIDHLEDGSPKLVMAAY